MFERRPYLLNNTIQKYSWGMSGKNAFIPKLLGITLEKNEPSAELWMGGHPSAPSKIYLFDSWINLNDVIRDFPVEILGQKIFEKFGSQLPFLFKVLSAAQPLSIQVHPNKTQAEELNSKDPEHYPDKNHKPEIAIAIDELKMLVGFKTIQEFDALFERFPGFRSFFRITKAELKNVLLKNAEDQKLFLRNILKKLFDHSIKQSPSYFTLVEGLRNKIVNQLEYDDLDEAEILFHDLYPKFNNDLGLVLLLMMNFTTLEKGEAIFTPAGVPHAYIQGNIIECMANSDNVIRAGLTLKFKDVDSLKNIIDYSFGIPEKVKSSGDKKHLIFKTAAEEFEVHYLSLSAGQNLQYFCNDNPTIGILTEGEIQITWENDSQLYLFSKGQSFLLPASLNECKFQAVTKSKLYLSGLPQL